MPDTALPPPLDSHTLLVAAVIVHDKTAHKILLIRRGPDAKFAPHQWDLPVGKAARGEAITATAARELKEETGLVIDLDDLTVAGIIHGAHGVEAPNGFLTVVFATHSWTGQPANTEPHNHSEVTWWPASHIPSDFVPTTRSALVNYLQARPGVTTEGF